jgi:hypothetical protein
MVIVHSSSHSGTNAKCGTRRLVDGGAAIGLPAAPYPPRGHRGGAALVPVGSRRSGGSFPHARPGCQGNKVEPSGRAPVAGTAADHRLSRRSSRSAATTFRLDRGAGAPSLSTETGRVARRKNPARSRHTSRSSGCVAASTRSRRANGWSRSRIRIAYPAPTFLRCALRRLLISEMVAFSMRLY